MNDPKHWWTSKTIWTNGLALVGSLGVAFGFDMGFTPEVQGSIVAGIMAFVNIILRFVTKGPIA